MSAHQPNPTIKIWNIFDKHTSFAISDYGTIKTPCFGDSTPMLTQLVTVGL